MFGTCNHVILNASNCLCYANASEDWIRTESLPVTATFRSPANRASDRPKLDSDALPLMLLVHCIATRKHETAIKSGSYGLTG